MQMQECSELNYVSASQHCNNAKRLLTTAWSNISSRLHTALAYTVLAYTHEWLTYQSWTQIEINILRILHYSVRLHSVVAYTATKEHTNGQSTNNNCSSSTLEAPKPKCFRSGRRALFFHALTVSVLRARYFLMRDIFLCGASAWRITTFKGVQPCSVHVSILCNWYASFVCVPDSMHGIHKESPYSEARLWFLQRLTIPYWSLVYQVYMKFNQAPHSCRVGLNCVYI
jgi:hypothetical protein